MSLPAKALEKHILNSPVSQTKLPEKCTRTGGKNVNFLQDVQEMMARLKPRPEQGSPSKNRGKWWEHVLKLLESPAICTGEAALPPLHQHPAPSASPQAVIFAGPW